MFLNEYGGNEVKATVLLNKYYNDFFNYNNC